MATVVPAPVVRELLRPAYVETDDIAAAYRD
jgi:hypothetical protein